MENQVYKLAIEDVSNSIPGKTCRDFFSPNNQANISLPDLKQCIGLTKKFRDLDNSNKLSFQVRRKGYTIPLADIEKILAQNNNGITGIKIYFGIEVNNDTGDQTLQLTAIGTYDDGDSPFSDFNIPEIGATIPDIPKNLAFANLKPCPRECGKDNVLNTG